MKYLVVLSLILFIGCKPTHSKKIINKAPEENLLIKSVDDKKLVNTKLVHKTSSKQNTFISFKSKKVFIEVADTNKEREVGLMNRTSLSKNHGMLFIFDQEQTLSFWMKNTLIPLSIGYLDSYCTIIDIQQMFPYKKGSTNYKTYPSSGPARYALETNLNWFKRNEISIGDSISAKSKTLNICSLKK